MPRIKLHSLNLGLEITNAHRCFSLFIIIVPPPFIFPIILIQVEFKRSPAFFAFALPFPSKVILCELKSSTIYCDEWREGGIIALIAWAGLGVWEGI